MTGGTNRGVAVVIDEVPLRPPADQHRLARPKNESHHGFQRRMPAERRPKRMLMPILGTKPCAVFPTALQERRHVDRIRSRSDLHAPVREVVRPRVNSRVMHSDIGTAREVLLRKSRFAAWRLSDAPPSMRFSARLWAFRSIWPENDRLPSPSLAHRSMSGAKGVRQVRPRRRSSLQGFQRIGMAQDWAWGRVAAIGQPQCDGRQRCRATRAAGRPPRRPVRPRASTRPHPWRGGWPLTPITV